MNNNVPQWMLDSTTSNTEQNKEVDMIVAGFIGAFRKRGFDQQQIGILDQLLHAGTAQQFRGVGRNFTGEDEIQIGIDFFTNALFRIVQACQNVTQAGR